MTNHIEEVREYWLLNLPSQHWTLLGPRFINIDLAHDIIYIFAIEALQKEVGDMMHQLSQLYHNATTSKRHHAFQY
jgi:hypothetical protein